MGETYSTYSLKKRLIAFILLLTFIFLLLIGRLSVLQIISGKSLQIKAEEQWTRELPISAERGQILDCNGVVLAESYISYNIYVRASNVENPDLVATTLCKYIDLSYETVFAKATNYKISESLIKLQVEKDVALKIREENVKGIFIAETHKRYYPYGNFLSQVLGYTTVDNVGQSGLELYYDKFLKGIDGYSSVQSDIKGTEIENKIDTYVQGIEGCNIKLTIDMNIQKMAEEAALKIMEVEKPKSATILVMNPNTGEIVASTTKPSFSLNELPRDNITELNAQSKNLSVVDVYEPGSTFKVLTTAMALEDKKVTLEDRFYDPGYRIVDGERINCWRLHGHGSQSMVDGLCNSCNSVFVDLALRLGEDRLYEWFDKLGLGSITNIDFPGESGGIIMDKDTAQRVDIARMGFGQAVAVTPIQLVRALSAVVNGGTLMQPYLVSSISNSYNDYIKTFSPTSVRNVVSTDTSNKIKFLLEEVIKKASGYYAFIPGYDVGGKTGTSQKYEGNSIAKGKFVSSFIGTFPAKNPDYVILVSVDEPTSGAYYGSIVATPYAKLIIEGIIKYKNYQPNQNLAVETALMEKNITMPNLVGLPLSSAINLIKKLGLQYESDGTGGVVISQYPEANTMVFKNAITLICT